jgi:hypothetical protein
MNLIATPGAADANSYCTVAEAALWLADRLDAEAWYQTSVLQREQALIWATRLLDEQAGWQTTPVTTTVQALWWPCTDASDRFGEVIPPTIIPDFVQRATAEYALALLDWDAKKGERVPPGTTRTRIGTVEFEMNGLMPAAPMDSLPTAVIRLIAPYALPVGSGLARVLRV